MLDWSRCATVERVPGKVGGVPTTSWPRLQRRGPDIEAALATIQPASVVRLPAVP